MGYYSRITGEHLDFATPEEMHARRLARMRKIVWLGIGGLKAAMETRGGRLVMYTLTYAGVGDWEPRHIGGFCRWLRRHEQTEYIWVAELQRRGAVHYHLLTRLPDGVRWIKPSEVSGGWAHGWTWVTMGIQKPYYIMKYLQKGDGYGRETTYPKGLRLYCVSRSIVRSLAFNDAVAYRECQLPRWAVDCNKDDRIVLGACRVAGGIRYGKYVEYSPYAKTDLGDVAQIGREMYNAAWGSGLLLQA